MIKKLSSNHFIDNETYKNYCELYAAYEREQERKISIRFSSQSSFMKNDSGKNMISLIDPQFVVLLGQILTFGANKYAKDNWKLCEDTSRYKDALLRHLYAYLDGEQLDPESGMSHLGHAAFGLMCLNYFDNLKKDQK